MIRFSTRHGSKTNTKSYVNIIFKKNITKYLKSLTLKAYISKIKKPTQTKKPMVMILIIRIMSEGQRRRIHLFPHPPFHTQQCHYFPAKNTVENREDQQMKTR